MSDVLFEKTVLAAATSLPELSTGLISALAGVHRRATSGIVGGHPFLSMLLLTGTLISSKAALPQAPNPHTCSAGLTILVTCAYLAGLIFRPKRRILGINVDLRRGLSFAVDTAGPSAIATSGIMADWLDISLRLLVATTAGALLGFERSRQDRAIMEFRTLSLVGLASCIAIQALVHSSLPEMNANAAGRVIQGVLSGVGFIARAWCLTAAAVIRFMAWRRRPASGSRPPWVQPQRPRFGRWSSSVQQSH